MEKQANLKDGDVSKLKKFWRTFYGKKYSSDMVKDYKPQGDTKEVVAKKN